MKTQLEAGMDRHRVKPPIPSVVVYEDAKISVREIARGVVVLLSKTPRGVVMIGK